MDNFGIPVVGPQVINLTNTHEDVGSIPGLAQWVKDLVLPDPAKLLQCRLQKQLRSCIAMAVA